MQNEMGNMTAPVKEGDELDVTIESVGEKGDGLAKREGFVIFVPNTNQGDNVHIRVTRVLRKVGFGEVIGPASGGKQTEKADDADEAAEEAPQDSEDFGDDDASDAGDEEKQ